MFSKRAGWNASTGSPTMDGSDRGAIFVYKRVHSLSPSTALKAEDEKEVEDGQVSELHSSRIFSRAFYLILSPRLVPFVFRGRVSHCWSCSLSPSISIRHEIFARFRNSDGLPIIMTVGFRRKRSFLASYDKSFDFLAPALQIPKCQQNDSGLADFNHEEY